MLDTNIMSELDPDKKNKEWGTRVISLLRMYSTPLVDGARMEKARRVLHGTDIISKVKDSFEDKKFIEATTFKPLPILEGVKNTIVEEITKNPPLAVVNAEDPLSISRKDKDIKMLTSRGIIERDISQYQRAIGLGNYKVPYDKFSGNIKDFDDQGLDENDPVDVGIYKDYFQKLWYEIGAQGALDVIFKNNRFNEGTMSSVIKDVISVKTTATQVYVDQVTGEIKYKYIDPSYMYGIWGESPDGTDDVCRYWYKKVTLQEWLSLVGDDFDFDKDWRGLVWAINFAEGRSYTGFQRGGVSYSCMENYMGGSISSSNDGLIEWDNAAMFKINVGYIEWRTNEATSSFVKKDDDCREVHYLYNLNEEEQEQGYKKKTNIQQQWYKGYFIATSTISQYVLKFGKVYFQHLEGMNDEYSNGTLSYQQEQGLSVAELAEPILEVAHFAFYRFRWLIYHTKPVKEEYVLDEILTLAKSIKREIPQDGNSNIADASGDLIDSIIKKMKQGHYNLRVFPKVDGRTYPQLPPEGRKHGDGGIDPTAFAMQNIVEWAEQKILSLIGFNPMRAGATPPARESLQTENNIVASSQNATGYMYRMIQYMMHNMARCTLNYISDIIQFKDTMPYNWLQKIVGLELFSYLQLLEKDTAHRMGIFIEDSNIGYKMQVVREGANIALQRNEITLDDWLFLMNSNEPKLASARLAIKKRQKEKENRRWEMAMEDRRTQNALSIEREKQKTEDIRGRYHVEGQRVSAEGAMQSAMIQADSRRDVKQMTVDAEVPKQDAKSRGQQYIIHTEHNLKEQSTSTE